MVIIFYYNEFVTLHLFYKVKYVCCFYTPNFMQIGDIKILSHFEHSFMSTWPLPRPKFRVRLEFPRLIWLVYMYGSLNFEKTYAEMLILNNWDLAALVTFLASLGSKN